MHMCFYIAAICSKLDFFGYSQKYWSSEISEHSIVIIWQLFCIQKPYLVQGGFQSWVKQGLRIKELRPETTLTVLNEVGLSLQVVTLLACSKWL